MLASAGRQGNPHAPAERITDGSGRHGRPRARLAPLGLFAVGLLVFAGCAGGGATICQVEVVGLESWERGASSLFAAYRVRGRASAPAIVSLVARLAPGDYQTGHEIPVGPGSFEGVVALELASPAGVPEDLQVLLEVGARRCSARVRAPA